VQNDESKDFCAQIWNPEIEFDWEDDYKFKLDRSQGLFIYECHPGMATEQERVGTWSEFTEDVLLRIKSLGYNAIQLMAVAEHPYYGSFGYHVSNFFAPSSRFGTPDDLKMLVKQAHKHKIVVIMDLVHSHFVANLNEGLNELDGSDHHYCKSSPRGDHPYWGSKLFDYSKSEVVSFLLSNLRYWLEEFHFDGFRFDGVTSMLYTHHGYTEFDNPDKYFDCNSDLDAQAYLTLANRVIHMIKPDAVTIAEDVSGMPGITLPSEEGGLGFDYRLGMSLPDYWAKIIDDKISQIDVWQLWNVANNRLSYVPTVAYAESHDQAMVGGKTLSFRLMDSSMYSSMNRAQQNATIERGIALHKMIRLFTILTAGEAYLNFMGNEFGHPEWIDFPRAENDWSYRYARRQWSLVDNPFLRYSYLREFDKDMIALVKFGRVMSAGRAELYSCDTLNSTLVFERGSYLFVFNWSNQTIYDYVINVKQEGVYQIMMSTEDVRYGGVLENVNTECYYSRKNDEQIYIQIKNVAQSAIVLKRES
jgi:1,4-alpha-glucan branching enzyme